MKSPGILHVFIVVILLTATAQAQQRGGGTVDLPLVGNNILDLIRVLGNPPVAGAWWTNAALTSRMGITDDQKAKLDKIFESHRPSLESNRTLLEKEEAQLTRLLEAEPLDRYAALSQTYRVIQARGDMERTNALMTLEMREVLTRAQWLQVPRPSMSISYIRSTAGARGGGGRGPQ